MSCYSDMNEMVRFEVVEKPQLETLTALTTFCRRGGFGHVWEELLRPALTSSRFLMAFGLTDRPWPPQGVGSQRIEAVAAALLDRTGRAFLTPTLLDFGQSTNLGLAASVTKKLFEGLRDRGVTRMYYLVRDEDLVLDRVLRRAGFQPADFRAATEQAEYVEYAASPAEALEAMGLTNIRLGDVLDLTVDGDKLDRLVAYHVGLAAAIQPALLERASIASLLPGFVDFVATSPPGGIHGTAGPDRRTQVKPPKVRRPRHRLTV